MSSSRNRTIVTIHEEEAVNMIAAEIARIMTVSAGLNVGPQSKDLIYNREREAFFARLEMKEDEALIARWKAFRSACITQKTSASNIDSDSIKLKRLFNFTNTYLIRFLNSQSAEGVSTSSTTEKVTYALQKLSTKVSALQQSVAKETKKRSFVDVDELITEQNKIITNLDDQNAEQVVKAMRYATFFAEQAAVTKNRREALQLREQFLQANIDKIETSIKKTN